MNPKHTLSQPRPPTNAGWSSPVARQAHNLKVRGSNPLPATKQHEQKQGVRRRSNAFSVPQSRQFVLRLRQREGTRPAGAAWTGWGDDRIVGVSVDTMIVSTKSLMDTI